MELKDSLQEIVNRYGDRVYMSEKFLSSQSPSSVDEVVYRSGRIQEFASVDEWDSCSGEIRKSVCDSVRGMVRDFGYMNLDYVKRTGSFCAPFSPFPSLSFVKSFGDKFSFVQEKTAEVRSGLSSSGIVLIYRLSFRDRFDNVLASFNVVDDKGKMSMPHRKVNPGFRGRGVGVMILNACEVLCKENCRLHKGGDCLEVDVGQIDVLRWLIRNGYEPVSYSDEINIRMIFAGAEDLCVGDDYYVFTRDGYNDFATNIRESYFGGRNSFIMNSLRVKLKKKIV